MPWPVQPFIHLLYMSCRYPTSTLLPHSLIAQARYQPQSYGLYAGRTDGGPAAKRATPASVQDAIAAAKEVLAKSDISMSPRSMSPEDRLPPTSDPTVTGEDEPGEAPKPCNVSCSQPAEGSSAVFLTAEVVRDQCHVARQCCSMLRQRRPCGPQCLLHHQTVCAKQCQVAWSAWLKHPTFQIDPACCKQRDDISHRAM